MTLHSKCMWWFSFFLNVCCVVRVKHKFDFRVCMCMCVCVLLLQPEHYNWPPVERSDGLSMSVTGGQFIYNAQLVKMTTTPKLTALSLRTGWKKNTNHTCKGSDNFRKYAIPLYIYRYSSMQLCSENSCDFDWKCDFPLTLFMNHTY
jgi:hypothetical protein